MDLYVIEREGQRVLTTAQIADAYEAETKTVNRNFQRNKDRFEHGLHYFSLSGDELKQFKGERQNDATLKFVSVLYLWTEQGAFLLAKSLNTDKAWQAYNMLVSQYYKVTQQLQQVQTQALPYDEKRLIALENRVLQIEQQMTLHSGEQKRVQRAVGERVYQLCKTASQRPALFSKLYSSLKVRYHVDSYRDIKQHQLQDALCFIASWEGGAVL
ncbi:ORF6N domain-containing protein [Lysinibacillus sp. KU-BSD001]|uniref:ORF6N domain-containing protein n=1 Tax=Lysinibacillus sp. KU-BSD001 TaxID=3141328 RepID=UPI0036ED542C